MTISYSGNFARLLVRWKGSVWKTTWKELSLFLVCYYCVRFIYRYALSVEHKEAFEKVITEFDGYTKRIPLTFILGFYVSTVVKRWWEQFQHIGWPDSCLQSLCFFMVPSNSHDQETIVRRITIARYMNLSACLAYRDLSSRVRKRFPTLEHIVNAELMTEDELSIYQQSADYGRWFLPLQWAQELVEEFCRARPVPAPYVAHFLNRVYEYRSSFHKLFCYDWVCIPLVYTQVSALATYGYFVICLIGRQFIESRSDLATAPGQNGTWPDTEEFCNESHSDYYVPVFSILEFLFYVGWFKVGQDLMRPFEEDDDDYEINYILDRNIKVSVAIMNGFVAKRPPFPPEGSLAMWEGGDSIQVPYTVWSKPERNHPPKMHAYARITSSGGLFSKWHENRLESCLAIKRQESKRWRYF